MAHAVAPDLIVFSLATFLGALVAGLAGFAFGLIASAIWLHVITPAESAVLIAAFAIVIQGYATWKLRLAHHVARLLRFIIGRAAGIGVRTLLLYRASAEDL